MQRVNCQAFAFVSFRWLHASNNIAFLNCKRFLTSTIIVHGKSILAGEGHP